MSRAHAIANLVQLSQEQVDAAAKRAQQASQRKNAGESRLILLSDHLARQAQLRQQGEGQVLDINTLRNSTSFIAKLATAVDQQQQEVERLQSQAATEQSTWQALQRKLKSFETLGERLRQAQGQAERQREQRQTDELAQRLTTYRKDG